MVKGQLTWLFWTDHVKNHYSAKEACFEKEKVM